ncbi:response regulator transcription factor [Meiothermus ruber]|uniref:Two component transcriptional regulator, winged helix family n=1 Tax=Meiothermus ruber (strain ATCC 35948 / DSM 1279 / VKM B-1258 / 21) TaxID=504728 RepID=D3PRT1_MEIRD|nr:response regulator transcription factor [Meiothermus ruber]ADD28164.1 two component transcriptional regulator, winged helix family [Meiothermus ruber DSM 1279]AGK04634.1 winged helix family two component transcriptional regulator [Meiothermus ruber DSM 1279]MCL6528874.1 response regulator transcription factor [Meiothermus ruber]MCX7802493.1 response regulator transcription factor [Meiothermus ruber]GAO75116.1 winged helix family two component transcriptional regulator [Meiothermus ruber H32
MKPKVLLVEDEPALAGALADNLEGEGYAVEVAPDGRAALERWAAWNPDLVVLDVMLPGLNGLQVCRQMRAQGQTTPVLFLSAKGAPEERVEGLRVGGDDYLAKPFHLPEFLLRVKNLLRRRAETPRAVYEFAGHRIDFRAWTAYLKDGRKEVLGEREMAILRLLIERAGQVVSRDEILDRVWGQEVFPSSRTIDNFVVRLRRLFEPDPARPVHLHTVWGVGYRFTPQPELKSETAFSKEPT